MDGREWREALAVAFLWPQSRSLERHLAQICRWAALRLQGLDVASGLGREAAREEALAGSGPDEEGHIKARKAREST